MITYIKFFIAGASMVCLAYAQDSDVALATIRYELVHVNDTNDRNNPRKEQMTVLLGQQASMYLSHTRALRLKEMEELMASQGIQLAGGATVRSVSFAGASGEHIFHFPQEDKLILTDAIGQTTYAVTLPPSAMEWQIEDEVKDIGGYEAQRATGSFGGRDYTVWFATELPFPYGPWKLYGLPGLILEAADSKNEVVFNFVEFSDDGGDAIALPENAVPTNLKDFSRAKEAHERNPLAAVAGSAPAGGTSEVRVVRRDASGTTRSFSGDEARAEMQRTREEQRKRNNNPIELPKK